MLKRLKHMGTSLASLLVGMLLLSACNNPELEFITNTGLVYCSEGSPDSFNPHIGTSSINFDASSRVIFDRLFEFSPQGKLIPSLAQPADSYVSEDGLTYRISLKPNVLFHQNHQFEATRPLNASDVVFTFERQIDTNAYFHDTGSDNYSYMQNSGLRENLQAVEASEDKQTIIFKLKQPDANFLSYLAMDFTSVISKQYAEFIRNNNLPKNQFDAEPIGTGPYQFKRYEPNAFIRYQANPNYWDGEQSIVNLVFAITPDPSVRYARLISEECDVMAQPLSSHLPLIKANPELKIFQQAGLNIGFWVFNTRKPPLDNIKVRQALSLAINRQQILDSVYSGMGELSDSALPSTMPFHSKQIAAIEYDPDRARKLLQEAGYEEGFSIDIWPIPGQKSYMPDASLAAILMREDLAKIGVQLQLKGEDYQQSAFLNQVSDGEHNSAILGWVADNYDSSDFLSTLLSCRSISNRTNRTFWCNQTFDQLLEQARIAQSDQEKQDLYTEAQQLIRSELPVMPIASGQRIQVANSKIKQLNLSPTGISFKGVKKDKSK
jgi:ABC-type transport system substrate-binding protein